MAGQYRGTKANVKIKIARVLLQKRSSYLTSYPLQLSDIISLTTYDPVAANGWFDIGITTQPVTESEGFDVTEIDTQQFGVINTRKSDYNRTVEITPAEWSRTVLEFVKQGVDFNDDAVNSEYRLFYTNRKDETVYRVAVLDFDENNKISATIFPYTKRSGDETQRVWDKDNPMEFGVTLKVYTDPQILDSDGNEVAAYDIWQY